MSSNPKNNNGKSSKGMFNTTNGSLRSDDFRNSGRMTPSHNKKFNKGSLIDDSQFMKRYPKDELILERSKTGNSQNPKRRKSLISKRRDSPGIFKSSIHKRMNAQFQNQTTNLRNDSYSGFQKLKNNKITPVKISKKSLTPDKGRSEKNNSSLYDVSIKGGSILDKNHSHKNYG